MTTIPNSPKVGARYNLRFVALDEVQKQGFSETLELQQRSSIIENLQSCCTREDEDLSLLQTQTAQVLEREAEIIVNQNNFQHLESERAALLGKLE